MLATSYILSFAVRKLDYDIVLCRQAIDGDTAQVGPQEKLGITQITYVEAMESLEGTAITLRRNIERLAAGQGQAPVLLTVTVTSGRSRASQRPAR